IPLAPGRFSTITCCPRRSAIFGAMRRDMMSVVLPGGNGMMMRIGLDGYEEAAGWAPAAPMPQARASANKGRQGFIGSFSVLRERRGQPSQNGSGHHRSQHGSPPLRNDRQQHVGLARKVQRHLAAEHGGGPVGLVVMCEGAAALHRMLHVRERGCGLVVLVVAAADAERDAIAEGHD